MNKPIRVAILLYDEVELLDFAGPFEVFSLAEDPQNGQKAFSIFTVAERPGMVRVRNGLLVQPQYSFKWVPDCDLLVVPGGYGAEQVELYNHIVTGFIKANAEKGAIVASVCTGAFLLAQAGLLQGRAAVTHWMDADRLEREHPEITVKRDVKVVDEGEILTSAGISSGIALSLYLVKRLVGEEAARKVARRMEYEFNL